VSSVSVARVVLDMRGPIPFIECVEDNESVDHARHECSDEDQKKHVPE